MIGQREMKVAIPGKEEPLHLNLRGRPLVNENGEPLGSIYLFQDVTKLRSIEEQLRMQEHMSRLLSEEEQSTFHTASLGDALTGETQIMRQVIRLMERVARTDATVLVAGESGTGKELVARGIHKGSERATKPFVAVNCGAIPENLIESQLFGHKRGSFTGADADFIGYFGQADGGTIFLDEIGELPLSMQTKLLRVLQEKNIRPVGGTQDIAISVRIISATNRNLKQEVTEGRFREDLFYRLNDKAHRLCLMSR